MRGTRVLVTGAGGFIGSHLVELLLHQGASVRALCRYNSRNERGALDWIDQAVLRDVDVVLGDLRDLESVDRATAGVEVVLHLGAQIAIPYSYVNARDFFETNVLGSLNVAQAALRHGVRRVVHTVAGFVAAARSDAAGGRTLQLGTGASVSIGEIVERVGALLGRELTV